MEIYTPQNELKNKSSNLQSYTQTRDEESKHKKTLSGTLHLDRKIEDQFEITVNPMKHLVTLQDVEDENSSDKDQNFEMQNDN